MSKNTSMLNIFVYAHWQGLKDPCLMGTLHSDRIRGNEIFSFEYDKNWLHSEHFQVLDPDLQLYPGLHYLNDNEKLNFGVFMDSSPDRWGRALMQRREAALARLENRSAQNLFETDYLLGVYDGFRMGALRFKLDIDGPFLNENKEMAAPPWTSIRELEEISLKLEEDVAVDDPEYLKWLNILFAPGSSLGGARPKASVLDEHRQLWIAKFPSIRDQSDIGGWEIVTYELAKIAGLNIAECHARKFSSKQYTFLTKRFDRTETGERLHFASAMTMLGYIDGYDHTQGVSYLDMVEFISTHGANINTDLEELWRRIVFNICVSNTDDHLRNHGFILTPLGWILSPAYDINPEETGIGLKLNISENDNDLNLDLAIEVHEYFRLNKVKAQKIIETVRNSVRNWRKVAQKYGISKAEQEFKARAFSRAE